ncbi:MAG: chemotaxis protein CheW [Cyanobacteria bacterium SBLK]|nr:chemotaxis protein CheW [Cyanobacteria bacterium SBLK]
MLMLLFRVGKERYALDTTSVVEVIPKIDLIEYRGTQPSVAGRFNYQGQIVPVLELSRILGETPCLAVLSARIILVDLAPTGSSPRLLGLLVEQATETLSGDRVHPAENSIQLSQQPYLGDVVLQEQMMIQCLHPERLLSEQSYDQLITPLEIFAPETGEAD